MIVKMELEVAKELDEVASLAPFMITEIKKMKSEGKDLGQIVSALGPALIGKGIAALDKVDQIDDEYAANRKAFMATCGYRTGELVDALMPAKTQVVKVLPA